MNSPLDRHLFREPARGQSKVMAIFSFRYEAHLVPALIENIRPFVHGYVAWDDRDGKTALTNEPNRRNQLNAAALDMGADWILAVDPDERFEIALADQMRRLTDARHARTLWTFQIREMFTPMAWRSDGVWGGKSHMRLYPADAARIPARQALHGQWIGFSAGYRQSPTGLNLYHLRHISAGRGQHRRDTYAAADPHRLHHPFGYDYLADLRGCILRDIPPDRRFHPPHCEDGGLWGPARIADIGETKPDSSIKRLHFIAASLRKGGAQACADAAGDILHSQPDDTDMRALVAAYWLRADQPHEALKQIAGLDSEPFPLVLAARARAALGQPVQTGELTAALRQTAPDDEWVRHTSQSILQDDPAFDAPTARWRQWAGADARLQEGADNGRGPLAVIIIGFCGQTGLSAAIQSLVDQSPDAEIVVVNSGCGNVLHRLAPYLSRIRLIDVSAPLFVGAARNIGIDASRAPFVAFLAGDCTAGPGWIAARMVCHRAGAKSVSSPVVQRDTRSIVGIVSQAVAYRNRSPSTNPDLALHFGRSYSRTLLTEVGYFAPGLRVAEDEDFNSRVDRISCPVWAADVQTVHQGPKSALDLLKDCNRRAGRSAIHFRPAPDRKGQIAENWIPDRISKGRSDALDWLNRQPGLGPVRLRMAGLLLRLAFLASASGLRRADRRLRSADDLIERGSARLARNPVLSQRLAEKAILQAPQDWRGYLLLARAHLARSDVARAIGAVETAQSIAPDQAEPMIDLCQWLLENDQAERALLLCERAALRASNQPRLLTLVARLARTAGKDGLSLAFAQQALMFSPESADIHDELGEIHAKARRAELARIRRLTADGLRLDRELQRVERQNRKNPATN